jgi:hypothetical protein
LVEKIENKDILKGKVEIIGNNNKLFSVNYA